MIRAKFYKTSEKFIGFSVSGHSGYAESGEDIVCASVSSAVQLVCNTLTECFKIECKINVSENEISLKVAKPQQIGDIALNNAHLILEGLFLHLQIISEDYRGTIKLSKENVD